MYIRRWGTTPSPPKSTEVPQILLYEAHSSPGFPLFLFSSLGQNLNLQLNHASSRLGGQRSFCAAESILLVLRSWGLTSNGIPLPFCVHLPSLSQLINFLLQLSTFNFQQQ
jgi:hypothetical protein